jgi:hypothetical protein
MNLKPFSGLALLMLLSSSALADKAAYCAAYARDFADAKTHDKALWQHKYDIAQQSCMTEQKPAVATVSPSPPKAPKIKPVSVKPVAPVPPEPVATVAKAKLEPGSAEWNDYCAKKYTSFNAATGMYHSHTGIDRKCVVSNP